MKKVCAFLSALLCTTYAYGIVAPDIDGPKTITADKIEYDTKSGEIKTSGNTEIVNQAGQRLTLSKSSVSKNASELSGDDVQLWLGNHVYIESENVTRQGDLTIARNAMFTACEDCDDYGDAWQIHATTIKHNMDTRMIKFFNPVLWVINLPVLWVPYFEMPDPSAKHKSGFLTPDMGSTNKMGTQINIPFYIAFSDTHDLTLTGSILTQENPMIQAEHRLNLPHSEFRTRGAYTKNKEGEMRWYVFNNDIMELGEYARASVYLERASDKTFLQKYGFYDDQPYLDSGAKVELFGQSGYVVADTHIFQELRYSDRYTTVSGNILPNIRAIYQTAPLFSETFLKFDGDVLGISGNNNSYQRLIGDVQIVSPWTIWGGNRITASLSTRYDLYNFTNTKMIDGSEFSGVKNRFLPSGYLEWSLPLFRPSGNWTQIVEPRARLTVMRHIQDDEYAANNDSAGALLLDSTLFSDNRFSGMDLWENGRYADYGVRWAAFNTSGKTAEVFIGQTYDFNNEDATDLNSGFHDGVSDYVGRIKFNNGRRFNVASRFRLAHQDLAVRHIETTGQIGNGGTYVNIGHIFSQQFIDAFTPDESINEITAGVGIKLTDRWSVGFNAVHNLTYGVFQRHTGGIFYNHPCWYMSLQYRRDNAIKEDYVGNTTFQFRIGISVDGHQY